MQAIDAVISWVDGYDPVYQAKLRSFCTEHGLNQRQVIEPTRIQQSNEIYYGLQSLRRFAPWIRTIYLITNQQVPAAIESFQGTDFGQRIQIIDQNALLLQSNVTSPVFNSLSIEWLIWQINGLSDRFLYLNDDFFIIKPIKPDDFFQSDRLVLRGQWKTQLHQQRWFNLKNQVRSCFGRPKAIPNPHRAWQEHSARLAGFNKRFYLLPHAPFPLLKTTFEQAVINDRAQFLKNIQYPFRHPDQISAIPLMVHTDIQKNRACFDHQYHQAIMVNGETHSLKKIRSRLQHAHKSAHVSFVCMQSIDQASPDKQECMIEWLQTHIAS